MPMATFSKVMLRVAIGGNVFRKLRKIRCHRLNGDDAPSVADHLGFQQGVVAEISADVHHVHSGLQEPLYELSGERLVNLINRQLTRNPMVPGQDGKRIPVDVKASTAAGAIPSPHYALVKYQQGLEALIQYFQEQPGDAFFLSQHTNRSAFAG